MAGRGQRFAKEGWELPKPLISIEGKPMFWWALQSLKDVAIDKLIVIALQEHEDQYNISKLLQEYAPTGTQLRIIPEVTEGQLCTVLTAEADFAQSKSILVIPSDTLIESPLGNKDQLFDASVDGIISVFDLPGDHWSFARVDEEGRVIEVKEKERISNLASTGVYFFRDIPEFLSLSKRMITSRELTKGEFYIMPVYQKMLNLGKNIRVATAEKMWDMGTPAAKKEFEKALVENLINV